MKVDVKSLVEARKSELKEQFKNFSPVLEIISTSDDPASAVYVRNKIKTGTELGINVRQFIVDKKALTGDVVNIIKSSTADGIIVQLPLREGLDEKRIIESIPLSKDVDGFSAESINNIFHTGHSRFEPCTPKGIVAIIRSVFGGVVGKDVTIINRSNIVGKPLALMLINEGATVTVCNSHTANLNRHIQKADIVITAIGKADFFKDPTLFKQGALIIDVSINRDENGKLCGDCSKEVVEDNNLLVTPVPGGVGLATVLSLMDNMEKTRQVL